jgi:hypothetical protein
MHRRVANAIGLALLLGSVAGATRAEPVRLRYGLEPEQRWSAVQTIVRETRIAGTVRRDQGSARFAYRVDETDVPGRVRFDARMLSQQVGEEQSPVDFSVIEYQAALDGRGVMRGVHFELGEAEPPDVPGIERDPVAFRQMLRQVAEAWVDSVYWLPELPERALELGESFTIGDRDDVGGTDPGVRMEMSSQTVYTLREVNDGVARFELAIRSTVDAATAQSSMESRRRGTGEALFDLGLGMWVRHETQSEHRAVFAGAPGGPGDASARTITTIEMGREQVGPP